MLGFLLDLVISAAQTEAKIRCFCLVKINSVAKNYQNF